MGPSIEFVDLREENVKVEARVLIESRSIVIGKDVKFERIVNDTVYFGTCRSCSNGAGDSESSDSDDRRSSRRDKNKSNSDDKKKRKRLKHRSRSTSTHQTDDDEREKQNSTPLEINEKSKPSEDETNKSTDETFN